MKFTFFGSSQFSVYVLEELKLHKIFPTLVITTPDKPKGRKLVLTPTPVKIWAKENKIDCIDPSSLNPSTTAGKETIERLKSSNHDFFLVASYGKIIPKDVFEIPERKTLNIHPSLLPKYRGASPIQSQILNDEKEIGVSIMQIDEGVDTGPIVVQRLLRKVLEKSLAERSEEARGLFERSFCEQLSRKELEKHLAVEGARLFAHVLPEWLSGVIDPVMQNENEATYCKKIKKEDGELDIDLNHLEKNAYENLLKIKAFEGWPTAYFFLNNKRIIVTEATTENGLLKILKVIPEGKKEMGFVDFMRGQR